MELQPLFEIQASLGAHHPVGEARGYTRAIVEVTGGTFEGEKLKGEVLTPGGDWAMVGKSGFVELDVRLVLKTDDGASIYMFYTGVLEMTRETETAYGDIQFLTQPRFECGDERYAWLNHTVAVAEGRLFEGGVAYRVFACRATAAG